MEVNRKMKIFISYASEQTKLAKEITLALLSEKHTVFFDHSSLKPGDAYNQRIRKEIEDCQLFVFLVTPESVCEGRYTLTELEFAEKKWPNPSGKILPVKIPGTPISDIPSYLRAVTLLETTGNVAASVVAVVDQEPKKRFFGFLKKFRFLLIALGTLSIVIILSVIISIANRVTQALKEADNLQNAGHYEESFERLETARKSTFNNSIILDKESKLAMTWLENARVTEGKENFSQIVNKVFDILSRCSMSDDKKLAADCLAHIGWGDFLKSKDGQSGLHPEKFYQKALELDPENPYAHVLMGFSLIQKDDLRDAKMHFDRALTSVREREYVRLMLLAGLLYYPKGDLENEAIKVVNDMRLNRERLPPGDSDYALRWSKLWNIYYSRILNGNEQQSFLSALSPPDHLATFHWLFPEDIVPESKRELYLFFLGTFQELVGDNAGALATLNSLQISWGKENRSGRLPEKTIEAINRLSKVK
jgi:tetratricopeptide (TPR) repeat protein